jgi:phage terminase large subunit
MLINSKEITGSRVLKDITNSQKKIIVLEGGARSTKTYSFFQWIIINCFQNTRERYTIGRLKMTWVRLTLLEDFYNIWQLYSLPISPEYNPNRSDQTYYLNGNQITFLGLDEPQKMHGRTQEYSWINEAMEISQKDFTQIAIRTKKRIFLDYNPSAETHWIYDNVINRDDCDFFHSTMRDNPFLESSIIDELNRLEQIDPIAYKIYNLGLRAQQKGLIFKNFKIVKDIPAGARIIGWGLDFGFVNDPTTLIKVVLCDGELWVDEMFYERGLVNVPIRNTRDGKVEKNISDRLSEHGLIQRYDEIIADSAELKSIGELYASGWNMKPAYKPSIVFGIDILLRYKINITERSMNLLKEFKNYKWAVDKEGEPIKPPKPIDDYNHGIDAIRYVAVLKLDQRRGGLRRMN